MDVTTILKAAKSIDSLKKFIKSGELSKMIAVSQLNAAKEALSKSNLANSPKQQVWSAINHLESAHHHCLSIYKGKGKFYDTIAGRMKLEEAAKLNKWIMFLMAVCYKYLGEDRLLKKAIKKGKNIDPELNDEETPWIAYITTLPQLLDPRLHIFSNWEKNIPDVDNEHFDKL